MLVKRLQLRTLLYCTILANLVMVCGFAHYGFARGPSFQTEYFSGSGSCAFCHTRLVDQAGNDVSNGSQWRSTMMANAAKDPLWQAKVSTEVQPYTGTGLEQAIQEKCSRCHMGMARYQQMADDGGAGDIFILADGFLSPGHYLHKAAMDGVSCTLCHQIQADSLGTEASFTGNYVIDTTTEKPWRKIFGPIEDSYHRSMHRKSGFIPTSHGASMQMTDSAHCGSCHTLYTPSLSADGSYLGEFPEQTTYLEWEHSRNDKTCQECHMPRAVGAVKISNRPRAIPATSPFAQHHFVGGNVFMNNLLKTNSEQLEVTATKEQLDATFLRTLDLLMTKTAKIRVSGSRSQEEGRLSLAVQVENLAGHKFPSGFPSRRAWLHITITGENGQILFESGKPGADGSIEGNDGDSSPADFEPHYQIITAADQVQIYEPVMRNNEEEVTYTLLRAFSYAKDNRLLPAGFDKNNASEDIAVYGAAAGDKDFVGGTDKVRYEVQVGELQEKLTIKAELLFQSLSYSFMEDLAQNDTSLVNDFMGFYRGEDNIPVVVATAELSL